MIKVSNLEKHFASIKAVDDLSFSVSRGEVLGFLGPNGAGKSTTMRMITGYLPVDAGEIQVGDHDVVAQPLKVKSLIGYLPESAPLYNDMKVDAFLNFIARLRGLRGKARKEAVDRAVETCFLQSVRRQSIATLSKGYRHRTCFAQALLHDPDVLILDEPTDGLDPNQKFEMRQMIRELGREKAIIISTHILEEVDAVCSRVLIINNGKKVYSGEAADLRQAGGLQPKIHLSVRDQTAEKIQELLSTIKGIEGDGDIRKEDDICHVILQIRENPAEISLALYQAARAFDWDLMELRVEEPGLDKVFRNLTDFDAETESEASE